MSQYPKAGRRRTQNKKLFVFLRKEAKRKEKSELFQFEKVQFD